MFSVFCISTISVFCQNLLKMLTVTSLISRIDYAIVCGVYFGCLVVHIHSVS